MASTLLRLGGRPRAAWAALLVVVVGSAGCFDPRLPLVEPETEVINSPPAINYDTVRPQPGVDPVVVEIGEGCVGENTFAIDEVCDLDLPIQGELSWRWRIQQAPIDVESPARPAQQVAAGGVRNMTGTPSLCSSISSVTIDEELLNDDFFGQIDSMVGKTHRLDVAITDGSFVDEDPDSFDLEEDIEGNEGGLDYTYWLFRLERESCL